MRKPIILSTAVTGLIVGMALLLMFARAPQRGSTGKRQAVKAAQGPGVQGPDRQEPTRQDAVIAPTAADSRIARDELTGSRSLSASTPQIRVESAGGKPLAHAEVWLTPL